ncbi:hypothetical protein GE061_019653 [Apolygus lucorum]|uniref:Uncharacterized protein n=1 Tax=Apolygus lucorum TaxID=248454 RepID=A0A8S9X8Q9_APOLU|nr:hypothetical protein GE061_019653 [Apolygus lucorum]
MFSYITYLAVAVQVAAVWSCECSGPVLPGNDLGLVGGGIQDCGLYGAYGASGLIGDAGIYPGSAGIVSDAPARAYGIGAGLLPGGDIGGVASGLYDSASVPQCLRHQLQPVVRPVVEECLTNVPIIRKKIRHQTETYTRHVPVTDRIVSQQEEKYIRHIPTTQKHCRQVMDFRTRHVPVVKSRTRTVVEPYTTHVPITEKIPRTVEESITKHVPIVERRCRPVVHQSTRLVPVTERRVRPIVESQYINVPIKRRYIKNVVEQRIKAVTGPCPVCPPGTELNAASIYPGGLGAGTYPAGITTGIGGGIYSAGLDAGSYQAGDAGLVNYPSGLSLSGAIPADIAAYSGLSGGSCLPAAPIPPASPCLPAGPYSLDDLSAGGALPAGDLGICTAPKLPSPCSC